MENKNKPHSDGQKSQEYKGEGAREKFFHDQDAMNDREPGRVDKKNKDANMPGGDDKNMSKSDVRMEEKDAVSAKA